MENLSGVSGSVGGNHPVCSGIGDRHGEDTISRVLSYELQYLRCTGSLVGPSTQASLADGANSSVSRSPHGLIPAGAQSGHSSVVADKYRLTPEHLPNVVHVSNPCLNQI